MLSNPADNSNPVAMAMATDAIVVPEPASDAEDEGPSFCDRLSCSTRSSAGSIQPLEEMATCAIHLGRLEEPKLLHCTHVFCLTCLQKWELQQQSRERLACPLCRIDTRMPTGGVRALPTATAHQSIVNYIMDRQCRQMQRSSSDSSPGVSTRQRRYRRRSLERKQEILVHLARDFVRRSEVTPADFDKDELLAVRENLNRLITKLDADAELSASQKLDEAVASQVAGEANFQLDDSRDSDDSEEDAFDLSFIRHNMKRHSSYKLREIDANVDGDQPGVVIGDVGLLGESDETEDMLLLNNTTHSLLLLSDGRVKEFPVLLCGQRLQCHHMQVANRRVYVSGIVATPAIVSVVACLQLDGTVVRHIERPGGEDQPLFAGFFVDARGDFVVAQPIDQKVEFLTGTLGSTGHWFTFENLHPHYVTWTRERRMLWVSCPAEGHILIVNDRTGVYRKLTTTQIFDSVPAHIITTSDRRIVFTDNQRQRIFWIIRRSEFIFVQRLDFCQELAEITSIAPIRDDKILVATRRRIFFLKPARKLRQKRRSKCLLM